MSLLLRPARDTDAGKLGAMITQAVASRDWKPVLHTGAEDIAHCGTLIARGWVTVAERDGTVAGFVAREGRYVHALFVDTAAQNHGVGRALIEDAKRAQDRLHLWCFQANTGARRFYARAGFVEGAMTDKDNEEGLPDVRLHWPHLPAEGDPDV